jgi:hypothetical protein
MMRKGALRRSGETPSADGAITPTYCLQMARMVLPCLPATCRGNDHHASPHLERTDALDPVSHLRWTGGLEERSAPVTLPDGGTTTPRGLGTRNYDGGGGWSQEG